MTPSPETTDWMKARGRVTGLGTAVHEELMVALGFRPKTPMGWRFWWTYWSPYARLRHRLRWGRITRGFGMLTTQKQCRTPTPEPSTVVCERNKGHRGAHKSYWPACATWLYWTDRPKNHTQGKGKKVKHHDPSPAHN